MPIAAQSGYKLPRIDDLDIAGNFAGNFADNLANHTADNSGMSIDYALGSGVALFLHVFVHFGLFPLLPI